MPARSNIIERDVVVVGGGFGGCYLLKLLREKGFETTVLEAGKRLGGVWVLFSHSVLYNDNAQE